MDDATTDRDVPRSYTGLKERIEEEVQDVLDRYVEDGGRVEQLGETVFESDESSVLRYGDRARIPASAVRFPRRDGSPPEAVYRFTDSDTGSMFCLWMGERRRQQHVARDDPETRFRVVVRAAEEEHANRLRLSDKWLNVAFQEEERGYRPHADFRVSGDEDTDVFADFWSSLR